MAQEVRICGTQSVFEVESLRLCSPTRSKRERIVWTCAIKSESNTMTSSRYADTYFKSLITSLITLTNHPGETLLP